MISLADFQPLSIAKINIFQQQPRFFSQICIVYGNPEGSPTIFVFVLFFKIFCVVLLSFLILYFLTLVFVFYFVFVISVLVLVFFLFIYFYNYITFIKFHLHCILHYHTLLHYIVIYLITLHTTFTSILFTTLLHTTYT